ncbi:MAG: 4Fe-4S dicluster domain-containing protein [Bacteroidales bacterium]
MNKGFFFDLNKCVGCHACVVACQIENGKDQSVPWREISTYNSNQHPDLPVFHYSLACNHCEDAPCMFNCPAAAFVKEEGINMISHIADNCIGCKYCTWACPYDAPKFINEKGVVEKCTLCQHRLIENKKPACANLCPTGALDFKAIEIKPHQRLAGFTEKGIGPSINVVELRRKKAPKLHIALSENEKQQFINIQRPIPSKINMTVEWVLVIFTLLVPILIAYFSAGVIGFMQINPWIFITAGCSGLILSSLHLGKKTRAWRAVFNIRNSWLSREVFFYGLFLGMSVAWFIFPHISYFGYAAALAGFAAAWSIDKVYHVVEKNTRLNLHSAGTFLTTLFFVSLLTNNIVFIWIIFILKILLYTYRKIYFKIHHKSVRWWFTISRILIGFILPVFLQFGLQKNQSTLALLFLLMGEILDRLEFYLELKIIEPREQIRKDIIKSLSSN